MKKKENQIHNNVYFIKSKKNVHTCSNLCTTLVLQPLIFIIFLNGYRGMHTSSYEYDYCHRGTVGKKGVFWKCCQIIIMLGKVQWTVVWRNCQITVLNKIYCLEKLSLIRNFKTTVL